MSRKKIVAGNWKMNTTVTEARQLVTDIMAGLKSPLAVEMIIFPPFPFIHELGSLLGERSDVFIGAQNCSEHAKGAYTGEVSSAMLSSVGCTYVLAGHSERRTYFNENSAQLVLKIKEALGNGLKVIYCFGEQLAERKANKHFATVETQLRDVLGHFPENTVKDLVLAYEPVWAIGTGETASPAQAQEMHAFVRGYLSSAYSEATAKQISILYGGSCNAQNARELFACPDVDGGLIGGASLKAADFCKITESFS